MSDQDKSKMLSLADHPFQLVLSYCIVASEANVDACFRDDEADS